MALSQDQLDAFGAVARAGSFTRAARELHLSQPALSRRITNLEQQLETVLLVRGRAGATPTDAGRRLLGYLDAQRALEADLVGDLSVRGSTAAPTYRGVVRIAGVSSLVPGVALPALAPFLREHPMVQIEIHREVERRLADALVADRIDFAVAQDTADAVGIVEVPLGVEEFVLVESKLHVARRDVFLDVSPNDTTTAWFLGAQPARVRPRGSWTRSFMHDELGILLGVELGLGRAVKPRHTIPSAAAVRVDTSFRSLTRPVVLQYRQQRFYSRLHQAIAALLEPALRGYLGRGSRR